MNESRRDQGTSIFALVALTVAAFFPVLGAGFHYLDDPAYVTSNPQVLRGLSLEGLRWACTSFESANWHPLTWLSHMTDVSLFGLRAGAHHGMNLALHALAAALLLLALARLTGSLWPSFFVSALFAVHPLRVESVAWISERKDLLAGLLGMLTLLAYLRYARRPDTGRLLTVFAVFALGLTAKPTLVTLPFVLLILDWWPLGRLRYESAFGAGSASGPGRRVILEKIPLLALSAAASVVTYLAQRQGQALVSADVFPLGMRIGNAFVSYVSYLGKLLWPHELIPFYPHPGPILSAGTVALAFALLVGITAVTLVFRRRRPWLIAGWLWYLGTLVPMLGLVQVGLQGLADRYSYIPCIGLCLAVVWEARSRTVSHLMSRRILVASAAGILLTLSLLTAQQSGYWKDTVTLLSRVIAVDPRNSFAFNMLGANYLARGETGRAVPLFAKALELRPGYSEARYNLGLALAETGRIDDALEQFTMVILFNQKDAEALYNRGRLLLERGKLEEALRDFDAALAASPGEPQICLARKHVLELLGRKP